MIEMTWEVSDLRLEAGYVKSGPVPIFYSPVGELIKRGVENRKADRLDGMREYRNQLP